MFLFPFAVFAQNAGYTTENLIIGKYSEGTLYLPGGDGKYPLVILHAGSGPTDQNGNQPNLENNSLKFLAEDLAQHQIAVFTYNKRLFSLVKEENFDEKILSFDDLVEDAVDVIAFFKKDERFSLVATAGHSEGSLICMLATGKAKADAFISIAGAGQAADKIIENQIAAQAPVLLEDTKKALAVLKKGDTLETVNPWLMNLFRPSVQPYMISWLKYIPEEEIRHLNVPILILNGTKDMQVGVEEAELLKIAKQDAELVLVENMNHVLKVIIGGEKENWASYSYSKLPVAPELVNAIVQFINRIL